MPWMECFWASIGILALSVLLVMVSFRFGRRIGWMIDPLRTLLVGVVAAAVVLFVPLYIREFTGEAPQPGPVETFFISVHNTIRLFVVDGDFAFVTTNLDAEMGEGLFAAYSILLSVLFVLAPVLTFGFAMTFFRNAAAYEQYLCNPHADVFIFSELNEKSLALAESLHKTDSRRLLVFTDVFDTGEEQAYELINQAKKLGAICFKLDITASVFRWHSKKTRMCFFTIGEDSTENTRQALALIATYRGNKNCELYVGSTQVATELLLANAYAKDASVDAPKMRVRRIHEVRSLVTRVLYEKGQEAVFAPAAAAGNKITAVVVGMGSHGTEMTKALAWYGQMDGYELEIHGFEKSTEAAERFALACPELVGPFHYDAKEVLGTEEPYRITVHGGVDVDTKGFVDILLSLPQVTYVFVSLGNDELNIATAVRLRELFEQHGNHPYIHAIVYNTEKKNALLGITNYKGQPYDIHFIGDMRTSYSEAVLLDNEVEQLALKRHTKWGSEQSFWQYNYNYQSSIASAIHRKAKTECGIPGIEKVPADRTPEELDGIRRLEHRRWNAYMRAEGYCYGAQRNDLARLHPCLVPFETLTPEQQALDDD